MFHKILGKIAVAVCMILQMNGAFAASVTLNPHLSSVAVGESFSVDIIIDFSDEPTLGGGIDINFDSTLAQFDLFAFNPDFVSLSDPLMTCPGAAACSPIAQPDRVENIAFGNFAGIGGVFNIGTLGFTAVSEGLISLMISQTVGLAGPFISGVSYSPMSVDFNGATVSAVPLPAAIWMFLAGLGALRLTGRR